ncbi:MAG: molybdate ABC transporter substrate-binding protein [Proteobacteria bacterium]|nr:molybdate ABC transporter substrate-binding protein [Pseudomonadota bacterium]
MVRIFFIILFLTIGTVISYLMITNAGDRKKRLELHVLSGAGLIRPMEELLSSFEKEHQVKTVFHFGGSGELMGQLAMKQPSDIFIPGANKYIKDARKRGWISEGTVRDVVKHVPVIAVAYDNPKQIKTLEDLVRPGLAIALGDPDGCAIGHLADSILKKNELYDRIQPNIKVRTPTVNQLLLYVALSKVDAAIIWEDMASWSKSKDKLGVIRIPDDQNIVKTISIAVTAHSANRESAKVLCDFIGSHRGRHIWLKWGFEPCTD